MAVNMAATFVQPIILAQGASCIIAHNTYMEYSEKALDRLKITVSGPKYS